MKDEDLLELLSAVAVEKQEGAIDPRWERLARGELSADERAELLAEEGVTEGDITPLGDDFEDAMTTRLLADRRPARRSWWRGTPVLALAAALLLWIPMSTTDVDPVAMAYAPLDVSGDTKTVRSTQPDGHDTRRFSQSDEMVLVLIPDEVVPFAVDGTAWFVLSSGELEPWRGSIESSSSGSLRMVGVIGADLHLAPGEHQLVVVVHPDEASGVEEVARDHLSGEDVPWHVETLSFDVMAP